MCVCVRARARVCVCVCVWLCVRVAVEAIRCRGEKYRTNRLPLFPLVPKNADVVLVEENPTLLTSMDEIILSRKTARLVVGEVESGRLNKWLEKKESKAETNTRTSRFRDDLEAQLQVRVRRGGHNCEYATRFCARYGGGVGVGGGFLPAMAARA